MKAKKKAYRAAPGKDRNRYRGKRHDEPTPNAAIKPNTCGAYGGVTDQDAPCMLEAGFGVYQRPVKQGETPPPPTGKCMYHNDVAEKELAEKKAAFLEYFKSATSTLIDAASRIGVTHVTIWRWRQADKAFDKAYLAAQVHTDGLRLALVEDSQFVRILKGDHHAAESIFFLKNRGSHRWKDRHDIGLSGAIRINPDEVRRDLANKLAARANGSGNQRPASRSER